MKRSITLEFSLFDTLSSRTSLRHLFRSSNLDNVPNDDKINVSHDQQAQPYYNYNYNWRKHIKVQKSYNLHRTFGTRFSFKGQQTWILEATPLAHRAQKHD